MEFRNINTFLQIIETGSFTAAAEVLGYTQSTVSFQINQLEQELGCRLFDRVGRTVSLTEKGQLLHRHSLKLNHSIQNLIEDFKEESNIEGQIRIVSSDSICEEFMLSNYTDFFSKYPNIRLTLSANNTEDMIETLRKNHADLILTLDSHVNRPDLVIVKEEPMAVHFTAAKGSPFEGKKCRIHDIIDQPFILTEKNMSYRKILDEKLLQQELQIQPILEHGRTDIITKLVEQGPFITYLPDFVTEKKVQEGTLVRLDVEEYDLIIWKQLIHHRDKWISKALDALLSFIIETEFSVN